MWCDVLVMRWCRSACAGIYLHVDASNRPAIGLYRSRGFRRIARIRRLYHYNARDHDGFAYVLCINGGRMRRKRCAIL